MCTEKLCLHRHCRKLQKHFVVASTLFTCSQRTCFKLNAVVDFYSFSSFRSRFSEVCLIFLRVPNIWLYKIIILQLIHSVLPKKQQNPREKDGTWKAKNKMCIEKLFLLRHCWKLQTYVVASQKKIFWCWRVWHSSDRKLHTKALSHVISIRHYFQ